jgi:23S rRNA pseudouridine1911/1915/1917 synthase
MRLDLAVSIRFRLSRRAAREAVRAGRIDRRGQPADEPGLEVAPDEELTWHPDRPARHRVRSRLSVLFEDADLLIVDKPAGLLSVPTAERERDTLHARALDYLQHRYKRRPYAGIVHRLDKDTSGALIFARTREALHALQALFRAHDIEREYLALVEGRPPESGTLDADLVRDAGLGRRGVARPGQSGRRAVTRYRVLERLRGASLVSVTLETGRTHQIRIHFQAAGTPVLGDRVYRRGPEPASPVEAPRQMLHARRLGFSHPATGALVRVEAPPPEDFERVLRSLRTGRRDPGDDREDGDSKRGTAGPADVARREREDKKNAPPGRGVSEPAKPLTRTLTSPSKTPGRRNPRQGR